jgi:hypothetical protein
MISFMFVYKNNKQCHRNDLIQPGSVRTFKPNDPSYFRLNLMIRPRQVCRCLKGERAGNLFKFSNRLLMVRSFFLLEKAVEEQNQRH